MPTENSRTPNDLYLPPVANIFWLLAVLMLWLSLSSCFDSIVVFTYATVQLPSDLNTATFRIIDVSRRTPNFKVRFSDGATSWMSFPDRLGGNPKGGLEMTQITDDAREQLKGCMAKAKIRSVLSSFGRRTQVWDLECPQAHIHYGPEVAASEITQNPLFDLIFKLLFAVFFLVIAYCLAMVARMFSKKQ